MHPPEWIPQDMWDKLQKIRSSPEFIARSEKAKANKKTASEDGKIRPSHHMGSIGIIEHIDQLMKKNKRKVPCARDVFFYARSKLMADGTRKVLSKKDQQILDTYDKEKAKLDEQRTEYDPDKLYYNVVGGLKKWTVYGLGSATRLYYQPTRNKSFPGTSLAATFYTPGIMAELAESRKLQQETQHG